MLETVGTVFLVMRDDVKHSRRCTSEGNEHHYGFWRMILREFNMEQLNRIVMKTNIRWQALFESRLVISRSNTYFRGYQQTFPEFLSSLQAGSAGVTAGPVHVDLDAPAVTQLWDEVQGVIEAANACWMTSFLTLFGVEAGNGLSPFAVKIETPAQLRSMIDQFFEKRKQDARGKHALSSGIGLIPAMVVEDTDTVEDELAEDDDDDSDLVGDQSGEFVSVSSEVIEHHVAEIREAAADDVDDVELVENLPDEMKEQVEVEICFMLELAVKHGRHSENYWGVTTLAMSVNVLWT